MTVNSSISAPSLDREIGAWLRGLRVVRGLSLSALADGADICPTRVEAIESGGATADLREMARLLAAIDPELLGRLVEFALTVGAAANSIDETNQLSQLASRIVAAFGGVPSTATRHAVADLVEAIAGYGAGRRLNS
ncbi:helix-turn-helix domain-containing protein [Zavarzinia compransoris]|uniref:helix-turn-helix domain-containing protein n=1 Tax=Zavarzinia marina TaxID=2911065 RepID=UPI001F22E664|nr:helix-turn-helix transcriptional regulator [Zavarzinia marina]MCF4166492.1 helix-turn-helix domain-containing protein [Zavarzinia marina]